MSRVAVLAGGGIAAAFVMVGVIVVGLVGLAVLGFAAYYMGVGPAAEVGGDDDVEDPSTDDGEEGDDGGDAEDGDATDDDAETDDRTQESLEESPFDFTIDEIEECGEGCRDVTATLFNEGEDEETGIFVETEIFAGEDNTDPDDRVWEGSESIGTIEAGGSHTSTQRVQLGLEEAVQIDDEDGWVTIVTTIESDQRIVVIQDSEQID